MPKIIYDHDAYREASELIRAIFYIAKTKHFTVKKNRNRDSSYDTYESRMQTMLNWIWNHIVKPDMEENGENKARNIFPYRWKAQYVYLYFEDMVERYSEEKITADYIHSVIHAFTALKTFYVDLVKMKQGIVFGKGTSKQRSILLQNYVAGDLEVIWEFVEENEVLRSDAVAHGRKIDKETAQLVIDSILEKSGHKYGGKYAELVRDVLQFQLYTAGRIRAVLNVKKEDFKFFEKPIKTPIPGLEIHGSVKFHDKGGMTRIMFLSKEAVEMFKGRVLALKKDESYLFEFKHDVKHPNGTIQKDKKMSLTEASLLVAEHINLTSYELGLTQEEELVLYKLTTYETDGKGNFIYDEDGNKKVKSQKLYEYLSSDKKLNYRDDQHVEEISKTIKYSVNSHSMRKAALHHLYFSLRELKYEDTERIIELYHSLQYGVSVNSIKRRVEAQKRRLNQDLIDKGVPKAKWRNWNKCQLDLLACGIIASHSRYEVTGIFYVEIPPDDMKNAKIEAMELRTQTDTEENHEETKLA